MAICKDGAVDKGKITDRWRGRQPARLIVAVLTMRLVNTSLCLKHYLPLSGFPKLCAKTERPLNLCFQYVHVARFIYAQMCPGCIRRFDFQIRTDSCLINPVGSRQLQYFGRASTHRGARLHLHSPPCIAPFCEFVYICVCVPSLLSVHLRAFGFRGGHCISSIA